MLNVRVGASADGRLAARTALAAREGGTHRRLLTIRERLLDAAAQFSAYVDYPDDDIPALTPQALGETLDAAGSALRALIDGFDAGRVLREGIDTAIVGSPNVGKSTLMNRLAGHERSIVTDIAGTTRDVVEESVRVGEVTLRLADTAGLRATADPVERIGVERAERRMAQAALVLAVFDGSRPLTDGDIALADRAAEHAAVAVINKADLPRRLDRAALDRRFMHVVEVSARDGAGVDALADAVMAVTGIERLDSAEPLLTTERQRACAARALSCVDEAREALMLGMTPDIVSIGVTAAIGAIDELTGQRATESVVDAVFARFCVGK